jgi:hypothetical protein
LLGQVADQPGGELAAQELESRRRIIADYARLQEKRNEPDYGEQLVKFYSGLDPVEDVHFTRALATDFQRYSEAALHRADQAWDQARESWDSYRDNGGILGILRLEEQVSERYGEQAGLLAQAHNSANQARQVYTLLAVESSAQQLELHQEIEAEIILQRRSLQQLSMVLSPNVLNIKLALLAVAPADTQAQLN